MKFGVNFFPTVGPGDKPAHQYYEDNLAAAELADALGYEHVKTVEHYFFPYGGYSPDPVTFLSAAATRTSRIRLATGAVIPAFTHPVQLAGKLAMLDNLSLGRLDVGFGRAFLPDEFEAFGVPLDSSRSRFDEGVEVIKRLWTEQDVVVDGQFYRFGPVTMLPRPYQQPRPPVFVATAASVESCELAGRARHHLQLVPSIGTTERVQEMLGAYRSAWADGGGTPGEGRVQLSFTVYLDDDSAAARRTGEKYEANYMEKLTEAVSTWATTSSAAYPGYDKIVEKVKNSDFATSLRENKVLAGTPAEVRDQITALAGLYGDDVCLSLQTNPGAMPWDQAERTLRQFAAEVAPAFDGEAEPVESAR